MQKNPLINRQGWFILVLMLLCSFEAKTQNATQNKPKNYCTAVKSDNTPCKMIVKTAGSKCYHHSDTKIICGANTKTNTQCKSSVRNQGDRCWRHKQ